MWRMGFNYPGSWSVYYSCSYEINLKIIFVFWVVMLYFVVIVRDRVLETELHEKFSHDPDYVQDVLGHMAQRVEHTLDNHKRKILGAVSCDRDGYQPGSILNTINSGEMVRVLDSNTLPQDWIDINPRDIVVDAGSTQASEQLEQQAFSDDGASYFL